MKKEYEMSDEQLQKLMEASKPVPYMVFGGVEPISPQQSVNMAWENLGKEMDFHHMTVEPSSKGRKFFTAKPKEVIYGVDGNQQTAYRKDFDCLATSPCGFGDNQELALKDLLRQESQENSNEKAEGVGMITEREYNESTKDIQ